MTKTGLWHAILNPSSPRHDDWRRILGTHEVPLESPKTHHVMLGEEHAEAYTLDVPNLTADQRERLVCWLMNKFVGNLCPSRREDIRTEINDQIDTIGFPIRSDDVIVSFDYRGLM